VTVSAQHRLTPGRPTTYQFYGLFLPSIEWEMKIEGFAWSDLENETNELGTLFRNMRRQDVDPTHSLLSALPKILEKMPPNVAAPFEAAVEACIEGSSTDEPFTQLPGKWAYFRMGAANSKSPFFDEYVRIEAESQAADAALYEGDFRRAAELIQGNSSLRPYWNDAALQVLANATTHDKTLRPRLWAWLQLQVSVLAKWSICGPAMQVQQDCGCLADLLNGLRDDDSSAPGAQWLRAMVRLTRTKSLAKMLALVRYEADLCDLPSEATIKRWSRGSIFPVPSPKLEKFAERVIVRAAIADPKVDRAEVLESVKWYYWAARRFNSLLWFATMLHSESPTASQESAIHPTAPSAWLRAEFRRLQIDHAPSSSTTA
jgi:hypothetical protein